MVRSTLSCGSVPLCSTISTTNTRGLGHEPRLAIDILNAAVDSCYWPLYEVVDGHYRLTYTPERIRQVADFLRPQARFAHLLSPSRRRTWRRSSSA
jgi:pyruvate ferredoxin oxidoreductase beta subunit